MTHSLACLLPDEERIAVADAFYEVLGDGRFRATEHTTGPWGPDAQHAGGPAALLGGAMAATRADLQATRFTFEILRPVPVDDLTVSVEVVRPGARVVLVEGALSDDRGPCLVARAWLMRRAEVDLVVPPPEPSLPGPSAARPVDFFPVASPIGWHTSMDLRFVSGGAFDTPGPAAAWGRPRLPLVVDEDWTPLQRVLVLADAGNGVSAPASPEEWLFINVDLTVHLTRLPRSDWVALDAHSVFDPAGVGASFSTIHDELGPIGRGAQSLFVAPRDAGR